MNMDPATGLTVLGAAVGSKELLGKMLGPTADYLGGGLKDWTAKAFSNLGRIFTRARARLGPSIDKPGAVPPRVLKEVLAEGPFCEDELWAEYFGGVLASSRSDTSRDDRGARFAALVGRLSTYQVRAHFLFYRLIKTLFDGSEETVNTSEGREALRLFVPFQAFATGMEMTEAEEFDVVLGHSIAGLLSESLIGGAYQYGPVEHLRKNGFPDAPEPGIVVQPSSIGAELFLWAHGLGNVATGSFLRKETVLSSDVLVKVAPGVRAVKQAGPHLDDLIRKKPDGSPQTNEPA
jgi:hypothetical protein